MTPPAHPTATPHAVWTAAAVARRLGVAPGTLRSWSRRYGIGPAGHSPGRHRRYTAADVAELDTMCELVAQGVVLSAAAAMAHNHRSPPTEPIPARDTDQQSCPTGIVATPGWTPADAVGALVAAGADLDSDSACDLVRASVEVHGVVATWEGLCRPALRDLDPVVTADPGCTDSQLLLSWAISSCLRQHAAAPPAPDAQPVLLACAAAEQHTLGAEALYAALVEHGVPARMLGAAVPCVALLHAARRLRPAAVVVWAQRPVTAEAATLRRVALHTDLVLAAGPGWHHGVLPRGVIRVDSLPGALALLTRPAGGVDERAAATAQQRPWDRAPGTVESGRRSSTTATTPRSVSRNGPCGR